jgi:hypothetical protein
MAQSSEIKLMLYDLSKDLTKRIATDKRCSQLLPPAYSRAQNANTGGYWLQLGRLGRGLSVEFWLDHYSGLSSPRAWFGVSSTSLPQLSRLLKTTPITNLKKQPLLRYTRDISKRPPYQFARSLDVGEFDRLVHEYYASDRHFLGMYFPYPWRFSRADKKAIVRDAANLIALFCATFANATTKQQVLKTPGPWTRPDPRTEQAAVRHVWRHLEKAGYKVKSREKEICGYDLHATSKNDELNVEVKGCVTAKPYFFISRRELLEATANSKWRLAVILKALTRPSLPQLITGKQMKKLFDLEPTTWVGTLNQSRR